METNWLNSTTETKSSSSFTVSGPIVFVTFAANGSSTQHGRNEFKLSFSAVETGQVLSGNYDDYRFTHFHFRDPSGSVAYPQMKGDSKYSPREVVTFTISTLQNHTVFLNALDLQNDSLCRLDSFTRFYYTSKLSFANQIGNTLTDYRYDIICAVSNKTKWFVSSLDAKNILLQVLWKYNEY